MDQLQAALKSALHGGDFDFEALCLALFHFQANANPVYAHWLETLGKSPAAIQHINDIPFLPISLFKNHVIRSINTPEHIIFTSSGTTGQSQSRHFIGDPAWYHQSLMQGFYMTYGPPTDYVFLALLPGYLERSGSSLVYMVNQLIQACESPLAGFFLHADDELAQAIAETHRAGKKVFLWGVTFALLDSAAKGSIKLQPTDIVLETGGMKGRGPELIREALHEQLQAAFGVEQIHSEYGMTELLSQAYAVKAGHFNCPPWMRVLIRDGNDPFSLLTQGKRGGINVIDLANYESCAFIQTDDLGKINEDGSFEVLGRFDHSELRGCNLLYV